jgi:hypothetical protein
MLQCELTLYNTVVPCDVSVREVVNSVDCGVWDLQVQGRHWRLQCFCYGPGGGGL